MRPVLLALALALGACTSPGRLASEPDADTPVRLAAAPFAPGDVHLLDGPFRDARDRNAAYLLALEPDRLLHGFLVEAGLKPKAPMYGGWESMGVAGHSLGHYLTALSLAYAESGDARFRERIRYIVVELARAQSTDGYVAAIPGGREKLERLARGEVEAKPFDLNGLWVPWYTQHKVLAGLIDAYRHAGSEEALRVARRFADWTDRTTSSLSPEQWQTMLAAEHGGMNEALADLYRLTGDKRYLDLSRKFYHRNILSPLVRRIPDLEGKHANTQIPKVIGLARLYELLGADSLETAARFFWDQVVSGHTYAIGGNTLVEHFGPPGKLSERLGPGTAESCNTYNMLKLTRDLFTHSAEERYAEYYERALYNHILASQEPERGMFTYFMSMEPGHFKTYSTPDSSFWCCVGTGMENHTRYGEAIYFKAGDTLLVNLFIPSTVAWREKGLTVRQETRFPQSGATRFTIRTERSVPLTLGIRRPRWAEGPLSIRVNGEPVPVTGRPGAYLTVHRSWKSGDVLEVDFPMQLRTEAMPDNPRRIAILYGPIVLAGALGAKGLPTGGAYTSEPRQFFKWPPIAPPKLAARPERVAEWVRPVEGEPLTFRTVGVGRPDDVTLVPFYRIHHQRYTVYWDLVD